MSPKFAGSEQTLCAMWNCSLQTVKSTRNAATACQRGILTTACGPTVALIGYPLGKHVSGLALASAHVTRCPKTTETVHSKCTDRPSQKDDDHDDDDEHTQNNCNCRASDDADWTVWQLMCCKQHT